MLYYCRCLFLCGSDVGCRVLVLATTNQQHGRQMTEASFLGRRWKAVIHCNKFPSQIIITVTPLNKHYLQISYYLCMFSRNKFLEILMMIPQAAFCCLYLHSCQGELLQSIGSVDGTCGFVATTCDSGSPSLRVPSCSSFFVSGHFISCRSYIESMVGLDRATPLVRIS